jgi:chromosome segregation ATPase
MRSILASLTNRYSALEYAHDQATSRNKRLLEAHRLLSAQYQELVQELSALAMRHRSLKQEVTEMQTDALAHEAMMWQYERRLATQKPSVPERKDSEVETKMLLVKVRELQEENADMQKALNGASELLMASRNGQHLSYNAPG